MNNMSKTLDNFFYLKSETSPTFISYRNPNRQRICCCLFWAFYLFVTESDCDRYVTPFHESMSLYWELI